MPINVEAAIGDGRHDADDGFQLAYGPNGAQPRIDYTDEELGAFTPLQAIEYEKNHPVTWIIDGLLCTGTINLIASEPKTGKLQPLDTPIFTRDGWSTIGQLRIGDYVYTADGSLTKVVAKSPITHGQKCYRVTTKSGASTLAGAEHLWQVHAHGNVTKVVTTEEMIKGFRGRRWVLPVTAPLARPAVYLPIDPYILGFWLGNGNSHCGRVWTNANDTEFVRSYAKSVGYELGDNRDGNGCHSFTLFGLLTKLKALGLCPEKFIPEQYMLGSIPQRRALLAGLLDSDGYAATRSNGAGSVEFCSVRKKLAEQTLELVRSLGIKAGLATGRAKLNGEDYGPKYRVTFAASKSDSPFLAPRKTNALPERPLSPRSRTDAVVSIEEVPSVPMQCIKVAHPSGLYVTDRSFMVTHNTTLLNTMTYAVATGKTDFVGRNILMPGHVLYYTLEARMKKCTDILERNNAVHAPITLVPNLPDIWQMGGASGSLEHLCMMIEKKKPVLVIVDMMWHMFDIEDSKEYGEVSRVLVAVERMVKTRYTDTCVIFSVHTRKPPETQGNFIPDLKDVHGSVAFTGRAHTNILTYKKKFEKDIRYIKSVGRDSEGDIDESTPIGLCPDTGLVRLRHDLEQPTALMRRPDTVRCLNTVEASTERLVAAISRYCGSYPVKHVTMGDLLSWSGIDRKGTHNAKAKAINDGMVTVTGGTGARGHPFTLAISPGFTVPESWLARPLPRDTGYTEKYEDETRRLLGMGIKRGSRALSHLADMLTPKGTD